MIRCCLVFAAACAAHPIRYEVEGQPTAGGTCDARIRIRVIDQQHKPVADARLVVVRDAVRTQPVITNGNGFAHVCAPDALGSAGVARLEVTHDQVGRATADAPFPAQLVLGSSAALERK